MGVKSLDPTNQADWEKFGKKFEADFDALDIEQEGVKKASEEVTEVKTELEKGEIDLAIAFFNKDILPTYKAEREKNNWTGYTQEVAEFLETQFKETAKTFNFLDGDEKKINEAWSLIAGVVAEKVDALEEEIKKENQPKLSAEEEYHKLTPDEVWKKLESAGAEQVDMNYFFNLDLAGRIEFLMCSEDELKEKIKNLKEQRESDNQKKSQEDLKLEKERKEARIKLFGENVKNLRTIYLQKEYEFKKTTSKLEKVFGIEELDLGNAREDLERARGEYKEGVKHYVYAIIDLKGISNDQEAENMLNYCTIEEALNLQEEKMQIKLQKDPKLLQLTEDFFGKAGRGYLSFYKKTSNLLSDKFEGLAEKANLKFLKKLSGLGGKVAFGVGISTAMQGVAPYWAVKAALLATSVMSMSVEKQAELHKELKEKESQEIVERRLKALEEMSLKTDDELNEAMKKIFAREIDSSLEYEEGREDRNIKIAKEALMDSIKKMAKGWTTGLVVGAAFRFVFGIDYDISEGKNIEQPTSNTNFFHGSNIHHQTAFPSREVLGGVPEKSDDLVMTMNSESENEVVEKFEENAIVKNQEKIQKALEEIKSRETAPANGDVGVQGEAGKFSPDQSGVDPEMQPQEIATPSDKYQEIKIGETMDAVIEVLEGKGIKDTIAALLIEKHEELTEGKMGWDPNKYSSVEEWANKRAIGITGEFTKGSHDFDKVSLESKITLDVSNPADIRIVDFVDGQDVEPQTNPDNTFGSESQNNTDPSVDQEDVFEDNNKESAKVTEEVKNEPVQIKNNVSLAGKGVSSQIVEEEMLPGDIAEKNIEEMREDMARQEFMAASRIGIDPRHYAQINNLSTIDFINEIKRVDNISHGGGEDSMDVMMSNLPVGNMFENDQAENTKLGRVLGYLLRDGKIENPNQSIAETLRNVNEQDLIGSIRTYEGIFGSIEDKEGVALRLNEDEVYSEYMASLIQAEVKDMIGSNGDEGKVMRKLASLRGVAMRDLTNNELLRAFKEATKDVVGNVEQRDNDTVGKYIVRIIRKAYEEGEVGKLRDSIAKVEVVA